MDSTRLLSNCRGFTAVREIVVVNRVEKYRALPCYGDRAGPGEMVRVAGACKERPRSLMDGARAALVTVLYEQEERGDPEGWTEPPELRALIVRRTRGFGPLVLKGRTD